jgi:hypothetical protein
VKSLKGRGEQHQEFAWSVLAKQARLVHWAVASLAPILSRFKRLIDPNEIVDAPTSMICNSAISDEFWANADWRSPA